MMTRSLGTLTAFANSARTASRLGVASVPWATSKRYSVRFMSGFGRSSMILSSKVHAPALQASDQFPHALFRRPVDGDERDPRTRDAVYNGGPGGHLLDEREGSQVLLPLDHHESAADRNDLPDRHPKALGQHAGGV